MSSDRDVIDRVRSAADIVRTIGDYVRLRKVGRKHRGLCPFHSEKTPSFFVDEEKQLFHCFGCGTGGDVFKFLMLQERLDFGESLRMLAERHGIDIPRGAPREGESRGLRERLHEAHGAAAAYFRSRLAHETEGRAAREYLQKRGLRAPTIERLGIGFAPPGWNGLKSHLLSRGFTPSELEGGGLVAARSSGSGHYDRFRNRIVFPIVSSSGKVVGFGGRTIASGDGGEEGPKYVNSPESPIYNKGEILYGLYPAREALRRDGVAVLVEGYLDFASLFEAGIENVVASLGTAFTEGHARLLARYVDCVVVNFDADTAGKAAALRSLAPLVAKGLKVKVLKLPDGEDPDTHVRRIGAEAYRARLDAAPDYMHYAIEEAVARRNLGSAREKVAALNEILPLLNMIESPIERSGYLPFLAERLSIDDDLILAEIDRAAKQRRSEVAQPALRESTEAPSLAERGLVRVLLEVPGAREELACQVRREWLEGLRTEGVLSRILDLADKGEPCDYQILLGGLLENADEQVLRRIAMETEPVGGLEYGYDCMSTLERDHLQAECRRIQHRMEAGGDGPSLAAQAKRQFEISQRIRELS